MNDLLQYFSAVAIDLLLWRPKDAKKENKTEMYLFFILLWFI